MLSHRGQEVSLQLCFNITCIQHWGRNIIIDGELTKYRPALPHVKRTASKAENCDACFKLFHCFPMHGYWWKWCIFGIWWDEYLQNRLSYYWCEFEQSKCILFAFSAADHNFQCVRELPLYFSFLFTFHDQEQQLY